jgi:hypothetical protein
MGRHVNCPTCGSRCSASRFESDGCWSCNDRAERALVEASFEKFMEMDEQERWRLVFDAMYDFASELEGK